MGVSMAHTYFDDYGAYHRDPRNRLCHEIGIPLIVWSLFALLELVRIGPTDLAAIVAILVVAFYVRLSATLSLAALIAFAALYVVGAHTPWPLALIAFAAGWVFQLVGHAFEGRKPAFTTNLVHLLVGPLWILYLTFGGALP